MFLSEKMVYPHIFLSSNFPLDWPQRVGIPDFWANPKESKYWDFLAKAAAHAPHVDHGAYDTSCRCVRHVHIQLGSWSRCMDCNPRGYKPRVNAAGWWRKQLQWFSDDSVTLESQEMGGLHWKPLPIIQMELCLTYSWQSPIIAARLLTTCNSWGDYPSSALVEKGIPVWVKQSQSRLIQPSEELCFSWCLKHQGSVVYKPLT